MTAAVEPARAAAPDVLGPVPVVDRPTRLACVALAVPDPAATAAFLSQGLQLATETAGDRVEVRTVGPYGSDGPAHVLDLVAGRPAGLVSATLEVRPEADLARVAQRLDGVGASRVQEDDRADGSAPAALLLDVGGVRLELRRPDRTAHERPPLAPSAVRPRRLGHVNLLSPEPQEVVRVLVDGLGLRLSESVGDTLFFLRTGTEHHAVGVRAGASAGSHHVAMELPGWDSYRALCDRLADLGWTVEYGPGRHGPGANIFVYVRDPSSGVRFELFADMAHVPDDGSYVPPRWSLSDRSRTVNRWGPAPPESFLA